MPTKTKPKIRAAKKKILWDNIAHTVDTDTGNLLATVKNHPSARVFVLSALCEDCHEEAMLTDTGVHSHAEVRRINQLTLSFMIRVMDLYFPVRKTK